MDDKNAVLVTILNDADILTAAAETVVVYGKPIPFGHRLLVLTSFNDLYSLSVSNSPTLRIWAQWSVDGVSWKDFATDLNTTITATGLARCTALTANNDFGPFVRINVSLTTTGGAGSARLSVVANFRLY